MSNANTHFSNHTENFAFSKMNESKYFICTMYAPVGSVLYKLVPNPVYQYALAAERLSQYCGCPELNQYQNESGDENSLTLQMPIILEDYCLWEQVKPTAKGHSSEVNEGTTLVEHDAKVIEDLNQSQEANRLPIWDNEDVDSDSDSDLKFVIRLDEITVEDIESPHMFTDQEFDDDEGSLVSFNTKESKKVISRARKDIILKSIFRAMRKYLRAGFKKYSKVKMDRELFNCESKRGPYFHEMARYLFDELRLPFIKSLPLMVFSMINPTRSSGDFGDLHKTMICEFQSLWKGYSDRKLDAMMKYQDFRVILRHFLDLEESISYWMDDKSPREIQVIFESQFEVLREALDKF